MSRWWWEGTFSDVGCVVCCGNDDEAVISHLTETQARAVVDALNEQSQLDENPDLRSMIRRFGPGHRFARIPEAASGG